MYSPELGTCDYLQFLHNEICYFMHFLLSKTDGVGYFNRPLPEVDYFYRYFGLKVIFLTALHNCKPKMPSSD